ncbi:MAG: hypothetical protein M0D57_12465 [Sphingobacteriales bacterium JAD_PAG50586_3]|nr:MAG: hypothetical protein M0D57_12465 [Sphingobacteriales bacterium JAD_PAG50586_3]
MSAEGFYYFLLVQKVTKKDPTKPNLHFAMHCVRHPHNQPKFQVRPAWGGRRPRTNYTHGILHKNVPAKISPAGIFAFGETGFVKFTRLDTQEATLPFKGSTRACEGRDF